MMGAAEVHPWSSSHRLGLRSGVAAGGRLVVVGETTNGERRRCFRALFAAARFRNLRFRVLQC